jgi:hypothetical protein
MLEEFEATSATPPGYVVQGGKGSKGKGKGNGTALVLSTPNNGNSDEDDPDPPEYIPSLHAVQPGQDVRTVPASSVNWSQIW